MRCPNCNTSIYHEGELALQEPDQPTATPWYRLAPPRRAVCPQCGTGLRHNHLILGAVALLGIGFLASMVFKVLYPENALIDWLFWIFMIGLFVSVPLILHSNIRFVRDRR